MTTLYGTMNIKIYKCYTHLLISGHIIQPPKSLGVE